MISQKQLDTGHRHNMAATTVCFTDTRDVIFPERQQLKRIFPIPKSFVFSSSYKDYLSQVVVNL